MAGREGLPDDEQRKVASMEDSIASAHHRIDALMGETGAALRAGDDAEAAEAFACLSEALETHFDQEDHLYFPSIRTLRPEFEPSVARFGEAHQAFRHNFAAIQDLLDVGSRAEAERVLESFQKDFTRHEAAEEEMLRRLDSDLEFPG